MKNYLSLLYLLIPLMFFACQPDDDDELSVRCQLNPTDFGCPEYDPCAEIFAADSDFEIIDSVFAFSGDTTLGIPVDTSYGSYLFFRPKRINPRATYAWRVGLDPRVWTEPYVNLNWTGFEGTVNVSLDVTVPSHSCLGEEELVTITTTKSITITDFDSDTPKKGQYEGIVYNNGVIEDSNITIEITSNDLPDERDHWRIRGFSFPLECDKINEWGVTYSGGYSWLVSNTTPGLSEAYCTSRRPVFIGRLTPGDFDEITIDYWMNDDDGTRVHRQFVGRRVE